MKITNLKYMCLFFALAIFNSCGVDNNLVEAEKPTSQDNSSNGSEKIDNYLVDGELVYDHDVISKAVKNAYHIHYDFSSNKVNISSSESNYLKYLDTDKEFKKRMDKSKTDAKVYDALPYANDDTKRPKGVKTNYAARNDSFAPENHANSIQFTLYITKPDHQKYILFNYPSIVDMYNFQYPYHINSAAQSSPTPIQIRISSEFTQSNNSIYLRNLSPNTSSKTFYNGPYYFANGIAPVTITLSPKQRVVVNNLPAVRNAKSYR
jgi:hypothetical protein